MTNEEAIALFEAQGLKFGEDFNEETINELCNGEGKENEYGVQ